MYLHEPTYNYRVDECQKSIENSIFFSLDASSHRSSYIREKEKLINYLIKYAFAINESTNVNYGKEIWELAIRCIEYYDPSSGTPFLYYFRKALKQEKKRWIATENRVERTAGLGIPAEKYVAVKNLIKKAEKDYISIKSTEFIAIVCDSLGIEKNEAIIIIGIVAKGVQSQYAVNEDGEEYDVIDNDKEADDPVEEIIEEKESIVEKIDAVEKQFKILQSRQKPLIASLLTAKLYSILNVKIDEWNYVKEKCFYDKKTGNACEEQKKSISAKEIAENFGLNEASVSRSWKTFQAKINL